MKSTKCICMYIHICIYNPDVSPEFLRETLIHVKKTGNVWMFSSMWMG